jgi:glycosyltransferase involved in cell wall biosynthesis
VDVSDVKPLITTVIPTYRRPRLLRRAIMSVLAQSYPHFQVCIYDNASGDDTESIVRELAAVDGRVKYFCHAQNIGAMPNFTFGMSRVETPFFSLLSDDDVLLPDFFKKALEGFSNYPDALFSALATIHTDEVGHVTLVPLADWKDGLYRPPDGLLTMLEKGHPEWTAILFRKDVLANVGTLDPETGAPADLDYELRIAARWPVVISREPGAIFVSHRGSVSATTRLESAWPAWQKIDANVQQEEAIPPELRLRAHQQILRNFQQRYLALGGLSYVINKDWEGAEHASRILRDVYKRRVQAGFLRCVTKMAKRWPLVHSGLRLMNSVRKSVLPVLRQSHDSEYGRYAKFLKVNQEISPRTKGNLQPAQQKP